MGKQKTHQEFVEEILDKNSNIEILDIYTKAHNRIHCRCKLDGHEWFPKAYSLSNGQGCPICGKEKAAKHSRSKRKSNSDFKSQLALINPNIIPLEDYISTNTPLEMECLIHNYKWKARPNDLLRGHGCPICGKIKAVKNTTYTHEEFVRKVSLVHNDITILGTYSKMNDRIKCKCKKCGIEWEPKANNLLNNQTGCPICNISKGEDYINAYLADLKIEYVYQYRFNDCKYKYSLPFDFAIIDNNMVIGLIEYDGEQHFKPIDYFGGYERFQDVLRNDRIKNEYAHSNNIPLLRCNYKQTFEQVSEELAIFIKTIYK